MQRDLPLWLWLWLPISIWLVHFLHFLGGPFEKYIPGGEFGLIENLTVIFLIFGIFISIKLAIAAQKQGNKLFVLFALVWALGCFYFAGEEASWGQHYFGWATPETWQELNIQSETNLHNLGSTEIFDKIPRLILTIFVIIFGLIWPLLVLAIEKFSIKALNKLQEIAKNPKGVFCLLPTFICVPSAFLSVFANGPHKIVKTFDLDIPEVFALHSSESKECFLAIFLFLYVYSIYKRFC